MLLQMLNFLESTATHETVGSVHVSMDGTIKYVVENYNTGVEGVTRLEHSRLYNTIAFGNPPQESDITTFVENVVQGVTPRPTIVFGCTVLEKTMPSNCLVVDMIRSNPLTTYRQIVTKVELETSDETIENFLIEKLSSVFHKTLHTTSDFPRFC